MAVPLRQLAILTRSKVMVLVTITRLSDLLGSEPRRFPGELLRSVTRQAII